MKNYLIILFASVLFLYSCKPPNDPQDIIEYDVSFVFPEKNINNIYDIEIENSDVFVCGFKNGVHKYKNDFSFLNLTASNPNTIFENMTFHNSDIWVATSDGLYFSDFNKKILYNTDNTSLIANETFDIKFINRCKAIVANKSGLYEFDILSQKFNKIQIPDISEFIDPPYNQSDGFPFRIHVSKNGNIWIGMISGGLLHYNNRRWIHYHKDNSALNSNAIRSILETKNGDIFVGQWRGGVCKFSNGKSFKFDLSKENNQIDSDNQDVWAMELDKNNNLWIGTWGAVLLYDFSKNDLTTYKGTEFGVGFKVRTLKKDNEGNILMGLESDGIVEIKIDNK